MVSSYAKDFIDIDFSFTEEEKQIRKMAREFTDQRIIPVIREHFANATFPMHLVKEMGELGFFGATLEGYGCAGINNVAYGLIMQELERGDSAIRSFASVQSALVMWPIYIFGSEEQKNRWLPLLQSGQAIGCFGLTEPNHGSDPGGMRTTAVKDGNSYVLNGEKMWITSGSTSDVALIWAKENGVVKGFLVERGTPGFSASVIHGKWSMRASATSGLSFVDCRIPEGNLLPGAVGSGAYLQCLTQARYGIGWGCIGAASDCFETALEYALMREQFGKKIASFQLVQSELSWMATELTKAKLLALHVGRLKDARRAHFTQISMLKDNNACMALEVARRSRDLLGANGIMEEYPLMRHMMNLETVKTYEGTHNIHTLIIAERLTGIPAYT